MYPHQSERLNEALERAGVEALVACSAANVAYVTGYRTLAHAVDPSQAILGVFTRRGTGLVAPAVEAVSIATGEPDVDSVACHGTFHVDTREAAGPVGRRVSALLRASAPDAADAVATALATLGAGTGIVGLDDAVLTVAARLRLAERLGAGRVRSASDALASARVVKAPWEVECLQRALGIAETAIAAVLDELGPGVTEREAADRFEREVARAGAKPYRTIVAFGANAAIPAPWPSERVARRRDLVRFDVGCAWRGYYCDVARMAVLGEPDARQQALHDAIDAGVEAAMGAMRADVDAGKVFDAAVAAVRAGGLPDFRRDHVGHGIGLEPAEMPLLAPGGPPIEAGTVLCVETSYYGVGYGGVTVKETVLVTRSGAASLNRSRRGLLVLDE